MTYYFSAAPVGFYDSARHEDIPTGAIELSDEEYLHLIAKNAEGFSIEADSEGRPIVVDHSLKVVKTVVSEEVRRRYEEASAAPVVAQGRSWDGGFDSAIKLDAAKRLAEAAGSPDVTFFDASNEACLLDLATAQAVVMSVASAFQSALATKQALMRQIAAANTAADANRVRWPQ